MLEDEGLEVEEAAESEVRPVGEDRSFPIDVRIIAPTHRDLQDAVAKGRFREDLYYRLKVVMLRLPSLRERPEDIPVLARHFLAEFPARFGTPQVPIAPELDAQLRAHAWLGNVRELESTLQSAVAMSQAACYAGAPRTCTRRCSDVTRRRRRLAQTSQDVRGS